MKGTTINTTFKNARVGLAGLGVVCAVVLVTGCNKSESNMSAATVAVGDDPAAGKALFDANCMRCHSINGAGGRTGPELTHTGAKADRDQAWFVKFLKDPTAQNPRSRMPSFGHLSQKELDRLGAYLASLK